LIERRPWYHLKCPVQKYAWGSKANDSLLRILAAKEHDGVEPDKPAAELWMGAHPTAASHIMPERVALNNAIVADLDYFIGSGKQLSFLFKILHAASPLSIQAHPDKSLARALHKRDPVNYPDSNHKPELAMCLKDMKALVGFRDLALIRQELAAHPALSRLCARAQSGDDAALKLWYSAMMNAPVEDVALTTNEIRAGVGTPTDSEACFLDLARVYGDRDPGVFAPFFLNLMSLSPGEGIYLGPNEPHSYLGGQILECMAASDNVVRAGLTPKFCDVETLTKMLTYRTGAHEIVKPVRDEISVLYPVPVKDFLLRKFDTEVIWQSDLPGILIVLAGVCRLGGGSMSESLDEGVVVFFPVSKVPVKIQPDAGAQVYFCHTQATFFEDG